LALTFLIPKLEEWHTIPTCPRPSEQAIAATAEEGKEYLGARGLEGRLSDAINTVVAERAPDGVQRLTSC